MLRLSSWRRFAPPVSTSFVSSRPALVLAAFFAVDGFGLANWAARIPAVKASHGLSNSQLGVVLLAIAAGAFLSMPLAGALAARIGSTNALRGSTALYLTGLAASPQPPGFGPLLASGAFFGAGLGAMNVTLNAHAVAAEAALARPLLPRLHAAYSAGGLVGAATGGLIAAAGLDPRLHLATVAGAGVLGLATLAPALALEHAPAARQVLFARPRGALLGLGVIAFCCLLTEGAAADWSATFLHQSVGTSLGLAAGGYFAFSTMMALGRLCGDQLARRIGATALVRVGGITAALGLSVALVVRTVPTAFLGFALLGAGVASVVPLTFRAAAASEPAASAASVAAVSSLGWLGFLTGPPVIGALAGASSLSLALVVVVVALASIALLAGQLAPRPPPITAPVPLEVESSR